MDYSLTAPRIIVTVRVSVSVPERRARAN